MSVTSKSTLTARPEAAFVNGIIDDAMRAMMAMATTLLIGLIYPQSFKEYDTFATLQTMRIELPQDEGRFFFALLEQRNIS